MDYAYDLDPESRRGLQQAAKMTGLSLRELELLGQDVDLARAFARAVENGRHLRFLRNVNWHALDEELQTNLARSPYPHQATVTA